MMLASEINAGLKVLYAGQRQEKVVNGAESRVLFNDCSKPQDFEGRNKPCPVYWDDAGGGRSADFLVAQTNADEVKIGEFAIDVVPNNQVIRISTDAYLRARSNRGAWLSQQALRIDNGLNNLANSVEKQLFNSSHGSIGQVNNSSFATTSLDLVSDEDSKRFQVGMRIVFATTTTGALLDAGKSLKVTAVNKTATASQITVDANLSTVTGMAQNAYIFPEGDAQDGASTAKMISGLPDWLPTTSSATAFFGQDRTEAWLELGGYYTTGKLSDIVKAVTDAVYSHHEFVGSANIDVGYINPLTFAKLIDQLGQDVQRAPGEGTTAGYRYVAIQGPKGEIRMKPAMYCARSTVYLCDKSTLVLESMLEPVRIDRDDGMIAQRISNAKGLETRLDSHAQFRLTKPGCNIRLALS